MTECSFWDDERQISELKKHNGPDYHAKWTKFPFHLFLSGCVAQA